MAERPSRRLAVILHADVVGSTTLVQLDETLAHQRIQGAFHRFSETIVAYDGIAHELRGDALVAEFNSASDAVTAALAFQATNTEFIATLDDDIRPQVRMGISLGEVVIADNTITGAGVVLAQRLEQLAEPGGVCIQGAAYETVPKRLSFNFESLGECELKGFDESVRVYTVKQESRTYSPKPEATAPRKTVPRKLPDELTIAVLPFDNMSADPEQEFFADGMAEDIIAALSQLSALSVVARNSSFAYKGRSVKVQDIASDLDVRYVLEGSVRKSGTRARITAQLIDALDGHHLWAERFDRELDDVFEVQDDITRNVVIALQVKLSFGEHARIWQSGTQSFEAWQCQIRGVQGFYKFTPEGRRDARECFEKAVSMDPDYLAAWAALGFTLCQIVRFGDQSSTAHLLERAEQISTMLLEKEHGRANGYAIQANLRLLEGRHELAVEIAHNAVALAPDSPDHRGRLAHILVYCGEPAEALRQLNLATRISPHHPNWFTVVSVLAHYLLGNMERAREEAEQAVARFPDYPHAYISLAGIYSALGLDVAAGKMAIELLRLLPAFSLADYAKSQQFVDSKDTDTWIGHLSRAGLQV